MIKQLIFGSLMLSTSSMWAQSFAPAAGQNGSTAIHKDSSVFVAWASGITVKRGFLNAADTTFTINGSNKASFGVPENGLAKAEGTTNTTVSLGDGGSAILTFDRPIQNGVGADFAVFENAFTEEFLELAFVEVSSDGENFFRFPATSELSVVTQIGGFGTIDCRYINNFAGKYKQGFGTPFDLDELDDAVLLNKNQITHVKIIDVIGSINPLIATKDHLGNAVNDPFPTPFETGGFDLDGVGVIHQQPLSIDQLDWVRKIYPNPANDIVHIELTKAATVKWVNSLGLVVFETEITDQLQVNVSDFPSGMYVIQIITQQGVQSQKVSIVH